MPAKNPAAIARAWSTEPRWSAWLMRFTTCGTDVEGYRLWSGYMCPERFASAATCQPER